MRDSCKGGVCTSALQKGVVLGGCLHEGLAQGWRFHGGLARALHRAKVVLARGLSPCPRGLLEGLVHVALAQGLPPGDAAVFCTSR